MSFQLISLLLLIGSMLVPVSHLGAKPSLVFPFTVHWEILRSGFNSTLDVALEADTYGEEWTLEVRPNQGTFLRTPRGTTAVVGIKSSEDRFSFSAFDLIVIRESELARLLGIQTEGATAPWGRELFLDFNSEATEAQTVSFKANPKYFVSVSLRFQL